MNTNDASKIFRVLSQNPEFVKTLCTYRNNPFHFAICKSMIN